MGVMCKRPEGDAVGGVCALVQKQQQLVFSPDVVLRMCNVVCM